MRSLRSRLILLWLVSLVASVSVGALLVRIAAQSSAAQVGRAEAQAARACDLIRDRYGFYATGWHGPVPPLDDPELRQDLLATVVAALARQDGVEGGIWQAGAGPLAYAFPTDPDRSRPDRPAADLDRIRALNARAARDEQAAAQRWTASGQVLLAQACPLPGPIEELTAWAVARVQGTAGPDRLSLGLGVLFALMVAMSVGIAVLLLSWSRRVRGLEAALAGRAGHAPPLHAPPSNAPPGLDRTGDPDLDRIVDALNLSAARLGAARREAEALAAQVTAAERLAALGRVAAGIAHEIRNPIATMRLRAENALASDDHARRTRALHAVLDQVGRLDRLTGELLVMTQRRHPQLAPASPAALLAACADAHADGAAAAGVTLSATAAPGTTEPAMLDEGLVRRVLDNLVGNALRHAPRGGAVMLSVERVGARLRLAVGDTGPGVPPELRAQLFEPFVTGRADGTGLGLAIARELADAHGGRLTLDPAPPAGTGARFVLDLPAAAHTPHEPS